jgi:C1A family cysteine protease
VAFVVITVIAACFGGETAIPKEVDWRGKGVLPKVISQGAEGCSVPLVATEAVESYHAIHTGHLLSLSSAEALSCCTEGCLFSGANIFDCIAKIGGLCSEASYPHRTEHCENSTCLPVAKIDGGEPVPTGDEGALAEAVARGPVMAAIDVTVSFQTYRSGVFEDPLCSNLSGHLNHLVLVAGYGTENGVDYWIVQNTWGEDWGMQGFIYMARNRNNMCGIATNAGYPV